MAAIPEHELQSCAQGCGAKVRPNYKFFYQSKKEHQGRSWKQLSKDEQAAFETKMRAQGIYKILNPDRTEHKCTKASNIPIDSIEPLIQQVILKLSLPRLLLTLKVHSLSRYNKSISVSNIQILGSRYDLKLKKASPTRIRIPDRRETGRGILRSKR